MGLEKMNSGREERGIDQEMTKFEITRVSCIKVFLVYFCFVLFCFTCRILVPLFIVARKGVVQRNLFWWWTKTKRYVTGG